jgi:hypothetical protein
MRSFVRISLLTGLLLSCAGMTHAQVSLGIRIGPPPPPRVLHVRPVAPGPDYVWIDGYWYPSGGHYIWHRAYWSRPPYDGAHWIAPHHDGTQFFAGYWDGPHGRFEHDHHWDHDRDRDYGRWH